jgi:hypothetical protein
LAEQRDPRLRQRVPRERICVVGAGLDRHRRLVRELRAFRERLHDLGSRQQSTPAAQPRVQSSAVEAQSNA